MELKYKVYGMTNIGFCLLIYMTMNFSFDNMVCTKRLGRLVYDV